jgi:predicted Fe-Mo cluster-binding NifX family protein
MKVAVTSLGPGVDCQVHPRFGRAPFFVVFETETGDVFTLDNAQNLNAVQGAGIQAARNVIDAGAKVLITANVGPKALAALKAARVEVYVGAAGPVRDAVEQFKAGRLRCIDKATVEGRWG